MARHSVRSGRSLPPSWLVYLFGGVVVMLASQLGGFAAVSAGWFVLMASAPALAIMGLRRHRPSDRRSWTLHVTGLSLGTLGAVLWGLVVAGLIPAPPSPMYFDILLIGGLACTCGGVFRLVALARTVEAWAAELDGAIVAVGVAIPTWLFIVGPALHNGLLDGQPLVTLLLYSLVDLALLSGTARLVLADGRQTPSCLLLLGAAAALLSADTVRWLFLAATGGEPLWVAAVLNEIWIILIVTAFLHPSIAHTNRFVPAVRHRNSRSRLFVFLALAVVGPIVNELNRLTTQAAPTADGIIATVLIAALGVLLVLRMRLIANVAQTRAALLDAALQSQRLLEAELRYLALHDSLTGLGNRAMLSDELANAVATQAPSALLLLDLDGFKTVNDTLGHPAGDLLLVGVADRLRTVVREGDLVARLGGDEFAVLLVDCAGDRSLQVAQRAVEALRRPFYLRGLPAQVTTSVGVADGPLSSSENALQSADSALYAAKHAGKNQVVVAGAAEHPTPQRG